MKKNNQKNEPNRISATDFINAEEFNDYNVPMPDSMRRKKRRKNVRPQSSSEGTKMPERQDAERRLEQQRQRMETLEYVRKQELAREAEVQQQKRVREQMLLRQQDGQSEDHEADTQDKAGKITVTSVQYDDIEADAQSVEQEDDAAAEYDDDKPSFTYLNLKDGKISVTSEDGEELPQPQEEDDEKDDETQPQRSISQQITPETATVTDIRQERKKQKNKRLVKRLVALGIVAALAVTAFVTAKRWIPKLEGILDKPHDTIVNDGKTEGGNFPLKISQTGIITISHCSDNMVTLDGNKVVFYNSDGSQLNAIAHNYGTPVIDVCSKRILAYDNAGKAFQVMTKKNTVYSKKTDNPIIMAKIGSNGYVAVVTQTEKYSAFVTVYDETGAEIYTWASGRRVVGICFNEDGKGCCISAISSSGGKINSVIYAVKFDSKQAVMTSDPLDTLAIQARKTKNGKYWVVGDDRFIELDDTGKAVYTKEYNTDLVSYDMSERYAAVYTDSVTGTHGNVMVFDCEKDGSEPSMNMDIQGKPKKLQIDSGSIMILTDKSVESYDPNGHQLATANISENYLDFVYTAKAVYLLGYREIDKIKFDT